MYHNKVKDFKSYFLTFDDISRLEIMHKPNLVDDPKSSDRTCYVHISFSVGNKSKVDELTAKLKADGYDVIDCVLVPLATATMRAALCWI